MHYLILARHGEFDEGSTTLNSQGIMQAQTLANKVASQYSGNGLALYSSTGPRSQETASRIADLLKIAWQSREEFQPRDREQCSADYPTALTFLKSLSFETVMVVMAGEFAKDFFTYVGEEMLATSFPQQNLERGEARVIDFVSKSILQL